MKRLLAILLIVTPSTAISLEKYNCLVEDFVGFERNNTEFIEANRRKTFSILRDGDIVVVLMKSSDFVSGEDIYRVSAVGYTDLVAVRDGAAGRETLVMPKSPANRIQDDGYFKATISLQSNLYNNTWLLRCAE